MSRAVILVAGARFLSGTGTQAAFIVGVWGKAAFEFEVTAGRLAILMAALGLAWFLGSAAAGSYVDRQGPRRVFVAAEILVAVGALIMIAASSFAQLVVLAALVELVSAASYNAIITTPPYLAVGHLSLRRVNVMFETAGHVSTIAGAGAGALVARLAGLDWVFVLQAAASLMAAGLFWVTGLDTSPRSRETQPIMDGLRFVYSTRSVRFLILLSGLLWMSFAVFETLAPLFFRDVVGTEVDALGWIGMVFGVGLVFGSMAVIRLPQALVSATGLAAIISASGVVSLVFVATGSLTVVAVGAVLWGFVFGMLEPVLRILLHTATPRRILGRVNSTAEAHAELAALIPLAFVPLLASAFGVQVVLIANGVLLAMFAALTLPHAVSLGRNEVGMPRGPIAEDLGEDSETTG